MARGVIIALVLVTGLFLVLGCGPKKQQAAVVAPETGKMQAAPVQMTVEQPKAQETVAPAAEAPGAPEAVGAAAFVRPSDTEIQQALKNAGVYQGEVDGKIGPMTKKAIEEFQTKNELTPDGKVGRRTWEKLQPYLSSAMGTTSTQAQQ